MFSAEFADVDGVSEEVAAALQFWQGLDLSAGFAGSTRDGVVRKSACIAYMLAKADLLPYCDIFHRLVWVGRDLSSMCLSIASGRICSVIFQAQR